jgi:NitT/TauT family transport system permease protein
MKGAGDDLCLFGGINSRVHGGKYAVEDLCGGRGNTRLDRRAFAVLFGQLHYGLGDERRRLGGGNLALSDLSVDCHHGLGGGGVWGKTLCLANGGDGIGHFCGCFDRFGGQGMKRVLPVLTVLLAIVVIWYAAAARMNAAWSYDQAARAGEAVPSIAQVVVLSMNQERPILPTPHQVAVELAKSTFGLKVTSKKSLIYHGWITLSATLLGFAMGTGLGMILAVGIVHNRAMDASVMPWAIASQTIPILALAPMIIVVMNALGVQGLIPKAIISAFLSFFPVLVGMVKGLRSPDGAQLDLMATYFASPSQILWKLRLPAAMPYLFASLKVGIAASLVGAIVGELPTGAVAGLGARLLSGSYYGQTVQIWAALFAAAVMAASLVALVGWIEARTLRRMGMAR